MRAETFWVVIESKVVFTKNIRHVSPQTVPHTSERVRSVAKRLLRLPEVLRRTGQAQSTWYEGVKNGTCPKPVPIGVFAVAWVESEVDEWIEERIKARDSQDVKPLRRKYEKKKQADQIGTEPQPA